MAILERVSDEHGSVVLGWPHAGVFYARFERSISLGIAQRFARRFTALMGASDNVCYFGDSSAVVSYDPHALSAVGAAMMAMRRQFGSIIVLPWRGVMGAPANAFADAFGCLEYVATELEFERRFRAVVPGASALPPSGASTDAAEPASRSSDTGRLVGGSGRAPAGGPIAYSYVFDLSDFEAGHFTATRSENLGERSRNGWVCVARDDQQALALARQAALVEWAKPSSRRPEDFTVEFFCYQLSRERPFDHGR